ncbi:DUF3923 family protein [Companilactobacillus ginsenosidimutans]|uniref:NADH:ubiquinone oxidoreductase n=1 Tax=Companilactobacillus ginsenosidimutans TaxID=1007676 RepID=A0A0H4QIH7_9LACO|nr:DUF3923 family protein [Companilactobacillus ginsenosidimutans]AKP67747.1 NADH:ubiquinone oxidoreductase [Companilactobacillus ginsenosidimutans]
MKIWWGINIVWIILFVVNAIFVMLRKVDATGAQQTMQVRLFTLGILGIFFIFIVLCQLLALYFIKRSQRKK